MKGGDASVADARSGAPPITPSTSSLNSAASARRIMYRSPPSEATVAKSDPTDDFGPTWVLLRPLPDPNGVPASVRFRRALKCLLRVYRIRNEGIRSEPLADTRRLGSRKRTDCGTKS